MIRKDRNNHIMQQTQLKIAFHRAGGESCTFGPIYLRNLFYALRQLDRRELTLSLLASIDEEDAQHYARSLKADEVILYTMPKHLTPLWAINGITKRLLSRNMAIERVLREHQVTTVFGFMLVHKYRRIPTLSWLPDFQHLHLPKMFSEMERFSRTRTFLLCAKLATRIILMSEAVKKDFESFAPMYVHKVRVLHPVSYVPQSIYDYDLNKILHLYHLPIKFVYLPNQFWKHKNHEIVFQAVKVLKDRGVKVFVVCAGHPVDYRHPTYFSDLFHKLSQWNIRDQVVYLGSIRHEQVLLLMRQSICVLNPSFFEGWGATVDETRSVGKQVLLSSIPAHCEQNPSGATFFDPHNCADLAEKLGHIWGETVPGPDVNLELEARQSLPSRLRAYATGFVSIARDAIGKVGR